MNSSKAFAECLQALQNGEDVQVCLAKFPEQQQELQEALALWQLMHESLAGVSGEMPLSREAFFMQIARKKTRPRMPLPMKFAALAAVASLACLALQPDTSYGLVLSMGGSLVWLSWWFLNFLPRLYYLKVHHASAHA